MGTLGKRPAGVAPGMRLEVGRSTVMPSHVPPSGSAQLRGDQLNTAAAHRGPRLREHAQVQQCGSGTGLVLVVVLAAFLLWLFV